MSGQANQDIQRPERLRCNGVFKGGGAKGLAYVGALQECSRAGIHFDAVAGSSAGAITAALVAAGLEAAELPDLMASALQTMDSPISAFFRPGRSSLLSGDALRTWLDDLLIDRCRVGTDAQATRPFTFADLDAASPIGLYVVAMDLATRQPLVFCHELTPSVSVADAVVASAAIPVAFPPALLHVDGEVRRLVDGGAYANYPAFVFDDPAFREHHQLSPVDIPTLGFILDEGPVDGISDPTRLRATDTTRFATDRGAVAREMGVVGALLSSPLLRWSLILLPLLFSASVMLWLSREAADGFGLVGSLPLRFDPIEDVGLMALMITVSVVGLIGIAVAALLVRLGRDIFDVGAMGAVAAMGVGPNVPYWVGSGSTTRHIAIRIPVPPELGTLAFRAPNHVIERAVHLGQVATARRLADVFGAPVVAPPPQTSENAVVAAQGKKSFRERLRHQPTVQATVLMLALYFYGTVTALFAGRSITGLVEGDPVASGGDLAVTGILTAIGVALLATRRSRSAAEPFPILGKLNSGLVTVAMISGLIATAAILAIGLAQGRASIATVAATTPHPGVVGHVDDIEPTQLVWVEIGGDLDAESIGALSVDARGTTITPCGRPDLHPAPGSQERIREVRASQPELAASDRCLVFDRDGQLVSKGDDVTILADPAIGLALLERDRWSTGFLVGPAIITSLALISIGASYHSARALRWRQRQQRLLSLTSAPNS